MELWRARRSRLALAVALLALGACGSPAAAGAEDLKRPTSLTKPPPFHELDAREVLKIADRDPKVVAERRRRPSLRAAPYTKGRDRWQVSYFAGRKEVAQVLIDDRTGAVLESWTGHQVAWRMARGYGGQFGGKLNAPYVWLPLCALFLLPFVDPRRPLRLVHLDLLVLFGFGLSHVFFNRGEIGLSVPLAYPFLGYLLVRLVAAGVRPRERREPLVPFVPLTWLGLAAVFLIGFRVALNLADSSVIDVGYAGVIGADRIVDGDELYDGGFPSENEHGDTYGPVNYLLYVPWEQLFSWSGSWDGLEAGHAAAISFDLLTLLGLFLLGRRLRPGGEGMLLGVALVYAWVAYPYTLFALQSNSNDTVVGMLVVFALLALSSAPARGALVGLAAAAKFAPLALAPLFAAGGGAGRRPLRGALVFGVVLAGVVVAAFAPFVPDGGLREVYDRTVGFQAGRDSPFSIWGQEAALEPVQTALKVGAAILALAFAFVPRRRGPVQVGALAAAVLVALQLTVEHWFYLYIVWFAPLALLASFAPYRGAAAPTPDGVEAPAGAPAARTPEPAVA